MHYLILDTGLFPDRETVSAALANLKTDDGVKRIDVSELGSDNAAWDEAVRSLLEADKVITL
jgi:hypothetical protein